VGSFLRECLSATSPAHPLLLGTVTAETPFSHFLRNDRSIIPVFNPQVTVCMRLKIFVMIFHPNHFYVMIYLYCGHCYESICNVIYKDVGLGWILDLYHSCSTSLQFITSDATPTHSSSQFPSMLPRLLLELLLPTKGHLEPVSITSLRLLDHIASSVSYRVSLIFLCIVLYCIVFISNSTRSIYHRIWKASFFITKCSL
jgi:hypothetical protein